AVDPSPAPAHQGVVCLVMVVEVVGQARNGYQPIGAGLVQPDEQAEAGDAGDAAWDDLADPVRQEGGNETIDGIALCGRRAPLRLRDMFADGGEALAFARRQRTIAQLASGDQRAMYQQVGIAADRRGEMGIARKGKAEMPDIHRAINSLRLASQ